MSGRGTTLLLILLLRPMHRITSVAPLDDAPPKSRASIARMNAGRADDPGDLTTPETFRSTITFRQWLWHNTPLLVAMFLVSALLFGAVLNAVGVPAGFLIGLVAAVPFCALLVLRNMRQFAARWSHQRATFSPGGVVIADPDTRVDLAWTNVDSVGEVELMRGVRPAGSSATMGVIEAIQGTREHGLVGAGVLSPTPEATALKRLQVTQFLQDGPADPRIGGRPLGIPLARFDPNWRHGRIGQWVRAYRPDLLD